MVGDFLTQSIKIHAPIQVIAQVSPDDSWVEAESLEIVFES